MDIAQTLGSYWSIRATRCSGVSAYASTLGSFHRVAIKPGESPEQAMYRELMEEVGLKPEHVKILGRTRHWLRYNVPAKLGATGLASQLSRPEANLVFAASAGA